jgi:hypothetical protein
MFLIRASWSPDKVWPEIRVPYTRPQCRSSDHHQATMPRILRHFSTHFSLSNFTAFYLVEWMPRWCVCVLFMAILRVKSISITGRFLSEQLTVHQLVRFELNLRCLFDNKLDRAKCSYERWSGVCVVENRQWLGRVTGVDSLQWLLLSSCLLQ